MGAGAESGRVKAAAGGNAGERWLCEVGVVAEVGESRGEERDTTYACFVSCFVIRGRLHPGVLVCYALLHPLCNIRF